MIATKPTDIIDLLEVFNIGLVHKIIDISQVTLCADTVIANEEEPDYFFIELSLCSNINDVLTLINGYIKQDKHLIASRVILGLLYEQLTSKVIQLDNAVSILYWLTWNCELTEAEKDYLYAIEDRYDLVCQGIIGCIGSVKEYATGFLFVYKDLNLSNSENWNRISSSIDDALKNLHLG